MDYILKRRWANDLIEQAIDLERQREDELRRHLHCVIHDTQRTGRHSRSYSQSREARYRYETSSGYDERTRHKSGSLCQHRQARHREGEPRECSLVTLTYRNRRAGKYGDEIIIAQHGKTVFKGCLRRGDQLTFKSKRYHVDGGIQLDFYKNDFLEDRMIACCEHALMNEQRNHSFRVNCVVGSQPCPDCQLDHSSSSPSPPLSPLGNSSFAKMKRSSSLTSLDQSQRSERPSIQVTNNNTRKPKPPVALNNRSRKTEDPAPGSPSQSNQRKSERKQPTMLTLSSIGNGKMVSEGFSADVSQLTESSPTVPIELKHPQQQKSEEFSPNFLPIFSSTEHESPSPTPPPPRRTYGPPQLSTMLSVSELLDSAYEPSLDTHEEVAESPKRDSLNILQKKDSHSDSDTDGPQSEPNQSTGTVQFLRSLSSHVETNPNDPTSPLLSAMSNNTAQNLSMVDDATQALLTRLGIMRQQQVERPEPTVGAGPREKGNVEYFMLVYLHTTPPEESTLKQLRRLVNFVKFFDDIDDCTAFINNISNEKIIFILSDSFRDAILSRIEDLQQVFTIYVLQDSDEHEPILLNKHSKIKGFYLDINEICTQISEDITVITRDLIAYMNISSSSSIPDPTFVYSQLINEIILDGDETHFALKELINFSRQEYAENDTELAIIDEFEKDYDKSRAVWWFTRQCFLSKMLNKALRVPEADVLFKLRLFIQHLHQQIHNESLSNLTSENSTVYLGQTIHQSDLEDLQKSAGTKDLLAFTQFLSGTTNLSKAIEVARNLPVLSDEYIPVILRFNIASNSKYANTASLRYTVDPDNDVLLNMGSVARIIRIEKDHHNETGMASIYLTLVESKNERILQQTLMSKRAEVKGAAPFVSLVKLMMIMNQQARAEQLVQMVFDDEALKADPDLQGSVAASCHILGAACHGRGDFKRAVELFHLSLETFLRFVPADSVQLSPTYNNIGSMYFRQEEFTKAIEYHQKALDVQLASHNPNLHSIASYSNNIGVVQLKEAQYPEAAKSFERALKILQQINQPNDPDLASTYDNLADAYLLQEKYDSALTYYSKALETQRLVQPRNPQALASFNNSIGNIYNKLHRYGDALVHFKRALECQLEYLPATHPSFASLYNNIGSMYYRQEQYADALPCYMKSLEIELMALPENHPTIAVTHFNIATTYTGLGRFDEAVLSTERSIEQLLKTLPANHPEVQENRAYITTIKRKQMLKGLFDNNTPTES